MNVVRLDLLAFGPFTGMTIEFGNAPGGMHLVYGPNEAGKSTTLRALTQLLYGIPDKCPDDFLHGYGIEVVGALLSARAAEEHVRVHAVPVRPAVVAPPAVQDDAGTLLAFVAADVVAGGAGRHGSKRHRRERVQVLAP